MTHSSKPIIEIRLDEHEQTSIVIDCPAALSPTPGQYIQAFSQSPANHDADAALPITLFPSEYLQSEGVPSQRISFSGAIPSTWLPGDQLQLRGPWGNGFDMPGNLTRLALVSLSASTARLLPLIAHANHIALFTDFPPENLPEEIEISPLSEFPSSLSWPEFIAMDCPIDNLETLNAILPENMSQPPCPTQVLVHSPMPCSGIADCGVCAVRAKRGDMLACKDGPVFDWNRLFRLI